MSTAITCDDLVYEVQFHPLKPDVLACAQITGRVDFFARQIPGIAAEDAETNAGAASTDPGTTPSSGFECVERRQRHKAAARSLRFFPDGRLATVSSDKSCLLTDAETGQRIRRFQHVSSAALNAVAVYDDSQTLVVGDDVGHLFWLDSRTKAGVVGSSTEQEDYISSLQTSPQNENMLFATSGDGTLGVYDNRKRRNKLFALSDPQDDELLSLAVCKNSKKIVVGAQMGDLKIFSAGDYGDCKDRILGHDPEAVNALAALPGEEEFLVSGCGDGKIRLVAVHHKKLGSRIIAELGEHMLRVSEEEEPTKDDADGEDEGEEDDAGDGEEGEDSDSDSDSEAAVVYRPGTNVAASVESLAVSPFHTATVASCSQDRVVHLWNFAHEMEKVQGLEAPKRKKKKGVANKGPLVVGSSVATTSAVSARAEGFFSDL